MGPLLNGRRRCDDDGRLASRLRTTGGSCVLRRLLVFGSILPAWSVSPKTLDKRSDTDGRRERLGEGDEERDHDVGARTRPPQHGERTSSALQRSFEQARPEAHSSKFFTRREPASFLQSEEEEGVNGRIPTTRTWTRTRVEPGTNGPGTVRAQDTTERARTVPGPLVGFSSADSDRGSDFLEKGEGPGQFPTGPMLPTPPAGSAPEGPPAPPQIPLAPQMPKSPLVPFFGQKDQLISSASFSYEDQNKGLGKGKGWYDFPQGFSGWPTLPMGMIGTPESNDPVLGPDPGPPPSPPPGEYEGPGGVRLQIGLPLLPSMMGANLNEIGKGLGKGGVRDPWVRMSETKKLQESAWQHGWKTGSHGLLDR